MNNEIKFEVIEKLKQLSVYHPNPYNTQHVVRCPYCGDSIDPSHGHFSIHIDTNAEDLMVYRCLKCDESGLLTTEVMEDLGIYLDNDEIKALKVYTRKGMRLNKLNDTHERYVVPMYHDSSLCDYKLDYVNNRLGTNFNYKDASDRKILLNFVDFIKANEMTSIPGLSFKQISWLNDNHVGFLSTNNNVITFRNLNARNKNDRYFKVKLNPNNVNKNTFYSIPNKLDIMYTEDINIHISEGTFDIISIYDNIVKTTDKNYFFANCGFGTLGIIKYLISHGINTGLTIQIYSDNDKTDWDHSKYLNSKFGKCITEWVDNIHIHRNIYENEKDYGVPRTHIIDTMRKFK